MFCFLYHCVVFNFIGYLACLCRKQLWTNILLVKIRDEIYVETEIMFFLMLDEGCSSCHTCFMSKLIFVFFYEYRSYSLF